jgi:hypothetical protein
MTWLDPLSFVPFALFLGKAHAGLQIAFTGSTA